MARNRTLEYLLNDLNTLLFVAIALMVGMYHLFFYATRYSERQYLWFGLGSVCFAVNAIAFSAWGGLLLNRLGPAYRCTDASGHVAAV